MLAGFARAAADPSRAAMLVALMDGRAWTVGELANCASVARSTASEHVRRLVDAGVVEQTRQGRHSYVTLAGPQVAAAVEAMSLATGTVPARPSMRGQRADAELVAGRTCYRHLAGRLGVQLVDDWIGRGLIDDAWTLTDDGAAWFESLGVDPGPSSRGPLLRPCLDWTERGSHAAGALGNRFAQVAFDRGWVVRGRHPRSVRVTTTGQKALGLPPDELQHP